MTVLPPHYIISPSVIINQNATDETILVNTFPDIIGKALPQNLVSLRSKGIFDAFLSCVTAFKPSSPLRFLQKVEECDSLSMMLEDADTYTENIIQKYRLLSEILLSV